MKTISSAQQVMAALNVLKKQEFKENEAINTNRRNLAKIANNSEQINSQMKDLCSLQDSMLKIQQKQLEHLQFQSSMLGDFFKQA